MRDFLDNLYENMLDLFVGILVMALCLSPLVLLIYFAYTGSPLLWVEIGILALAGCLLVGKLIRLG